MGWIQERIAGILLERNVRDATYAELKEKLLASGETIAGRIAAAGASERNRRWLRHITGIERWAQRRVRVALGDPFFADEYDGYRPDVALGWDELAAEFEATRRQTVAIIDALSRDGVNSETRVRHNDYGKLTVRGWLNYILLHGDLESRRLR